jgi:hypothetical protein
MRWSHVLAALAPLVLVALLVFAFASPPAVVPATAPPDVFSAERAMEDVRGLTSTGLPHPAGAWDRVERTPSEIADHARAQAYVRDRLIALGMKPEIQRSQACGRLKCGKVENVVARIEGTEPGPAVMLAAHYDSTPFGPGAADDGAGVATILETVRALRAGPPLRRTLIVLIDDGEEMGLLGAAAFVSDHPWAKDVGAVLNFEARGTAGQTAMFETSNGNAELVRLFAGAVDRPVASSVIYTAYKRLPNDTDLSVLKQAGMQGLNFAFADRVFDYHTANDTAAELDPRSLQHMGDQALPVARALLGAPALPVPGGDAVYFDLFTLGLVRYPAGLTGPLAALSAALAAAAIGGAVRRGRTSLRRVLASAAVWLGALVLSTLGGIGLGMLLVKIRFPDVGSGPMAVRRMMMGDHHSFAPWLALVGLSAAITAAFALWLGPRAPAAAAIGAAAGKDAPAADSDASSEAARGAQAGGSTGVPKSVYEPPAAGPAAAPGAPKSSPALDSIALAGGALVLWNVLSLLLGFGAPGASYPFTWTALSAAGGLAFAASAAPGAASAAPEPRRLVTATVIASLPMAILWFPIVRVLLIMVGPTMPPGATLPITLTATLIVPLLAAAPKRLRWALPAAAAALALGSAVVACILR